MNEFWLWFHAVRSAEWGGWYAYTIVSLVLYGVYQYSLDNLVTRRRRASARSVCAMAAVAASTAIVTILSGTWVLYRLYVDGFISGVGEAAFLGSLQGLLFLFICKFRFQAREVFPQRIVLPVTKASILLVILASWFLFGEIHKVTATQLVGFVLIGMSIYLFKGGKVGKVADSRDGKTNELDKNNGENSGKPEGESGQGGDWSPRYKRALFSLVWATVVSAAIALLAKYAVGPTNIDIWLFMFFSNAFTSLVGYALVQRELRATAADGTSGNRAGVDLRGTMRGGLILGVLNLLAYYTLLRALSLGDASVVIPMHSLYMIIPILLFSILEGEKLTEKTTVAVVLSVVSIMILRS